jgi:hypothetical protein
MKYKVGDGEIMTSYKGEGFKTFEEWQKFTSSKFIEVVE